MNWYQIFYWVTVADGVKGFFDVASNCLLFFTVAFFIIFWVIFICTHDNTINTSKEEDASLKYWLTATRRTFTWFLVLTIITWAGYVFCPSKKDALIIIAGGAVGNFITSDSSAKQIPSEITLLVREKLKSEIEQAKSGVADQFTDTLANKSKEELIEIIKEQRK